MFSRRRAVVLPTLLLLALCDSVDAEAPPYADDPEIVAALEKLEPRSALALPKHKVDATSEIYGCKIHGPATRGYTLKMVYAPERHTALYHGGDHQTLRSNDVWEYHLGSNTWHMIFEPDGGNQASMKGVLMFLARKIRAKPDHQLTADERKQFEEVRPWWNANIVLQDGYLTTKRGGPILPGHTWDTLVYDADRRLMIHGHGAYCSDAAVLHSLYTGKPLAEVDQAIDPAYSSIWMFDPAMKKWIIHKRPADGGMPELTGMGAAMCAIPEQKRVLYYCAAQNVSPHSFMMWSWDTGANTWTELKPNGGKSIADLVLREKVAPPEELQTAYSPKHQTLIAVYDRATYAYDVAKNIWSRLNDAIPLAAHDAKTMFAYDSVSDVFLLTDGGKEGRVAVFSLPDNRWELVQPTGDRCPPSNYGAGKYWGQAKGYFDPRLNALVVHGGMTDRVWVYRHGRR